MLTANIGILELTALLKKTKQWNKVHHKLCNGFIGYNGTCIGFNGNCNGPGGSLLVIGHLLLVAC